MHPVRPSRVEAREVPVRAGRVEVRPSQVTVDPVAGFYLIDVADLDEAVNVAARIPDANTCHVTLRPLLPLAGITDQEH